MASARLSSTRTRFNGWMFRRSGVLLGSWPSPTGSVASLIYLPADATTETIFQQSLTDGDLDDPIVMFVETCWLRPFDLLGWGYARRCQILLTCLEDTTVRLDFARDGAAYTALTTTQVLSSNGLHAIEWQLPGDQPCVSFRIRVVDLGTDGKNPITPSRGVILHGATVGVEAVDGIARLKPETRA